MGTKLTVAQAQAGQREAMIAEAAYFAAERRNFAPGNEISDWLAAEQHVDSILQHAVQVRGSTAVQSVSKKPAKVAATKVAVKKDAAKKVTAKKVSAKKAPAKKAAPKAK